MTHPHDATLKHKNVVTAFGNRALLERELGGLVHQLHRLRRNDPTRTDLKARRDGLLQLLDAETDRQAPRERDG